MRISDWSSDVCSSDLIPVGAVAMKHWIFAKLFDRMDRALVHGSTFGKNDMAMAAGIATLEVLEEEKLVERAAATGAALLAELQGLAGKHELVKQVRGKGLMIGLEFGPPKGRSEEHTSELQSLMRISYAVFYL